MMNLSMTDERKKFIYFIGPQIEETAQLVMYENQNIKIKSLNDFKNIAGKIGYQKGTFLGKAFEEKFRTDSAFRDKFEIIHTDELNIKKLQIKRIIGMISQNYGGVTIYSEYNKLKQFKIHPFVIHRNWVYFGFSKKSVSKNMLIRFQKAYKKAKLKGKFKKIIESYK